MNAADLRQFAASSNIANTLTDNYQRAEVVQRGLPGGGVTASLVPSSDHKGDLVTDIVDQMGAVYLFKANLLSIRVADQMTGTLLNLKA